MDQAAIAKLTERYRRLPPEDLADLDEERHQLSAEEATALDAVMKADDTREPIAQAIERLDARKRRNFRINVITFLIYIVVSPPLLTWLNEMLPESQAVGWVIIGAWAAWLLWQWTRGRRASPK